MKVNEIESFIMTIYNMATMNNLLANPNLVGVVSIRWDIFSMYEGTLTMMISSPVNRDKY